MTSKFMSWYIKVRCFSGTLYSHIRLHTWYLYLDPREASQCYQHKTEFIICFLKFIPFPFSKWHYLIFSCSIQKLRDCPCFLFPPIILTFNPSANPIAFVFIIYQKLTLLTTSMTNMVSKLDMCNIVTGLHVSNLAPQSSLHIAARVIYKLDSVTFLFIKFQWCCITLGIQSRYLPCPSWSHFYFPL